MIRKTIKVSDNNFRKFDDPLGNETPRKYIFYAKTCDVPEGIPMSTNPRDQKLNSGMSYRVKLRVKELLEEEGITQKKLAEMAGVRESTISDIVRGTRTVINFEHLGKIATALEISDIRKIIDLEKV